METLFLAFMWNHKKFLLKNKIKVTLQDQREIGNEIFVLILGSFF
jgi:hypothetical protein